MKCVTAEDNDEESVTDLETGSEEEDETRKKRMGQIGEVTTILSYFADYGEVLWFKGNANLFNFVITQPTTFVKSLRTRV